VPLVRGPLNPKAKGELGELAFMHKAASLGFGVARPHGDNELYDFIVDSGERFWRVQVKTTCKVHDHRYQTSSRHGLGIRTRPYTGKEIDFIVAYIAPLGIWYVIPVKRVAASTALSFYPSGCRQGSGRFEPYREAWHLMAPGGDATPQSRILRQVHAMACEEEYPITAKYELQFGAGTDAHQSSHAAPESPSSVGLERPHLENREMSGTRPSE
jgi:PD-(D/E)XK endonuclease